MHTGVEFERRERLTSWIHPIQLAELR